MKRSAFTFIALIMAAVFAACSSGSPAMYSEKGVAASSAPAAAAAPMASPQMGSARNAGFAGETALRDSPGMEEDVMDEPDDMAADMPPTGGSGGVAGPAVTPVIDSRKIIRNVFLELQTLKFDEGVDVITKMAEEFGGFVQDSYVQGRDMYNERGTRHASFTLRVPSERLDALVNSLGGGFNVISKNQNSQDVTETYFDSKARLDALKIQEERLLEMLAGATELEYMLQVEDKLMNVRYEIESLTASLNRLDSYVSMSTVNISLYEVVKYEAVEDVPVTFGERISRAFKDSIESFSELSKDIVVTAVFLFPLLIFLALLAVVFLLGRRVAKKRRAANAEKVKAAVPAPVKAAAPPSNDKDVK